MDTFLDVTGIVKRAKQVLNFKNDSELAEYLGVSRATVSNWGARNSIDFRLLLDKFGDKVDYNWLLLGKGNPKHQPRFCESELVKGEVEIIHNPKTPEPIDDRSVTLYDITAAANLKTLFTNKKQYALGKILIPNIFMHFLLINFQHNSRKAKSADIILRCPDIAAERQQNIRRIIIARRYHIFQQFGNRNFKRNDRIIL